MMPMVSTRASLVALAPAALALACATPQGTAAIPPVPVTAPPSAPPAAPRRLPNDIRWVRTAAEYRALTLQTFRMAADRVTELARGVPAGSWAVILDADETVLDNSEYQRRRALLDSAFTQESWTVWVREKAAPAVPGAVDFVRRVRTLGGRVAIVTNRADSLCAPTRENLASAGIETDVVLCQPAGAGDKNPRFERVRNGTAAPGLPALTVLVWVGDNIQDFPRLTQDVRRDAALLEEFGRRYFVLPNPMYGSWERTDP